MSLTLARNILDQLVAFPTVSRDSNLALVDWVEGYLAGHGVPAHRVWNADGTKAALYANVGPWVSGGVILSGHSDVVPVDGQAWTTDPWTVTERDGRLYGRGTCDMKGFVALALAAVPLATAAGVRRPLQIALSYDEEVGCTGAPAMIAAMAEHLPRAGVVIVGEPSMMACVNGHKGGVAFHIHARGHAVHSSMQHHGVNAIMATAPLIDWTNQINVAGAASIPGPVAAMFDPPYTCAHVGTISGGTAQNITAATCDFAVDFRLVPSDSAVEWEEALRARAAPIAAQMRAVHPDAGIDITPSFSLPALRPETDGAAESLIRGLTGDNATHVVSYGTEAGQFQAAGYSTAICGPGDIAQAHQADEYLDVAQFQAGWAMMERLVARLAV